MDPVADMTPTHGSSPDTRPSTSPEIQPLSSRTCRAGSAVALSAVFRTLPKDGTVVGIGDGSLALQQIVGAPSGEYDASKWQYLGAPSVFEFMYIASKAQLSARGIQKFEDHLGPNGKELVVGQTAGIGLTSARVIEVVAGARMKHVFGYAGTAQERTAMDGGEIDGFLTSWDSVKVTHPGTDRQRRTRHLHDLPAADQGPPL